jgi:actin-related protein 5
LLELITVEKQLLEHDDSFTIEHTRERQKLKRHCLMNAFYKGISPSKDDSSTIMAALDTEGNAEQSARLHINIERIRVPEPLYQPLLAGVDQAGLVEVVQYVLKEFSQDVQDQLTQVGHLSSQPSYASLLVERLTIGFGVWPAFDDLQHIYLTGGHITLPNFDVRLWNSLRPILPMNSPCTIFRPNLPSHEIRLLPWKGMARFSASPEFRQASISKHDYLECGNEYLKEHRLGNKVNF